MLEEALSSLYRWSAQKKLWIDLSILSRKNITLLFWLVLWVSSLSEAFTSENRVKPYHWTPRERQPTNCARILLYFFWPKYIGQLITIFPRSNNTDCTIFLFRMNMCCSSMSRTCKNICCFKSFCCLMSFCKTFQQIILMGWLDVSCTGFFKM